MSSSRRDWVWMKAPPATAAHRLRKRFREIYREELSRTLGDETDLEGELRHLVAVLARE